MRLSLGLLLRNNICMANQSSTAPASKNSDSLKSASLKSASHKPASGGQRPVIHRLPVDAVNRIAAGEVIERPAAAIKELVENSLDAGASQIDIEITNGGKTAFTVVDNGCGMSVDEMRLAMERHATSKLTAGPSGDYDLMNIATMGFRGEALPSIGAVARLDMTSKIEGADQAWTLSVHGSTMHDPKPAAFNGYGTRIEVRDLFYATPARLKFLKSDSAESTVIGDVIRRLAMARPDVGFSLVSGGRKTFFYGPCDLTKTGKLKRLGEIMGAGFAENAIAINAEREGAKVTGFAGLPTFNRGMADKQYLFVNGRPIRDRLVSGAVRAAYADFLARDRHPVVALFLECPPELVDVNVHPAKTEVRFRDSGIVRGLLVGALRHGLADAGHRSSTTTSNYALGKMNTGGSGQNTIPQGGYASLNRGRYPSLPPNPFAPAEHHYSDHQNLNNPDNAGLYENANSFEGVDNPSARVETVDPVTGATPYSAEQNSGEAINYPLGAARAQLHRTYVVSQTEDGLIIVDQHAAHERLVYEKMKATLEAGQVARQGLLIPEIVEMEPREVELLEEHGASFAELGLVMERFGDDAMMVRETPSMLGEVNVAGLLAALAADLIQFGEGLVLKERLEEVCSSMACHGSIRAGRPMSGPEMDALLRQMEKTPYSGQCNHGRPTYVELKLADIERLFGRR